MAVSILTVSFPPSTLKEHDYPNNTHVLFFAVICEVSDHRLFHLLGHIFSKLARHPQKDQQAFL